MTTPLDPRRFAGVPPVTDEELAAWLSAAIYTLTWGTYMGEELDERSRRIARLATQLMRERAAQGEKRACL